MEKKKIDIDTKAFFEKGTTYTDNKGNSLFVLAHIPYEQKQAFVEELANYIQLEDEELEICYASSLYELVYTYLFMKYYTDLDVSWVEGIEDFYKVYDCCESFGVNVNQDDTFAINRMWYEYKTTVIALYQKGHSLERIVKNLLTTDINTTNEETRQLIEKLTDMKGALVEKEDREGKIMQFADKNVRMNFAKR